jgi:thioredoxin-like negative regulator of GroEL
MIHWPHAFAESLECSIFLERYGSETQKAKWASIQQRVTLTAAQMQLVEGFTRRLPVLCLAGAWCGDCIEQGPILEAIARANPKAIDLRFLDREAMPEVTAELSICGGHRVPTVVWFNEDMQELARFGDRVLSKYRKLAADQLGPSCPTGLVPPDASLLSTMTAEWVDLFERAHLIARLSPKLRERHQD